jgi:hypothetical protein
MACRTYKISLLSAKKTRKVEEDERLGINNPGTSLAVTQKIIRDSWLFLKTSFSNEHVEYKCSDLSWKGHDSLLREQTYISIVPSDEKQTGVRLGEKQVHKFI